MPRFLLILAALLVLFAPPIWAQEFSERQEVAVFGLSYDSVPVRIEIPRELQNKLDFEVIIDNPRTGTRRDAKAGTTVRIQQRDLRIPTPDEVRTEFERGFTNVDQLIRQVFVNIGRFDVVGETYSVDAEDVDGFVRALREYRETTVEMTEDVQLGREAFTEDDFRRLTDGYYLVVPSVSYYRAELTSEATYSVEIQVSLAFINMETTRTFERFAISASGSGDNLSAAISSAVDQVPNRLEFRIRTVPEFQIMTGITDLVGRQILVEFGRNMGIQVGDEFVILTETQVGAYQSSEETGLIFITDVRDDFSFGIPLYAKPQPQVGDQLREVPRSGFETEVYVGVQSLEFAGDPEGLALIPAFGLKVTGSRGFYPIRPLAMFEFPFTFINQGFQTSEGTFIGGTFGIGAEYMLILRRLRLSPYFLIGGTGGVYLGEDGTSENNDDDDESGVLSHLGVAGGIRLGVHTGRDIVMYLEPGFAAFVSMTNMPSMMGPRLTLGINFK